MGPSRCTPGDDKSGTLTHSGVGTGKEHVGSGAARFEDSLALFDTVARSGGTVYGLPMFTTPGDRHLGRQVRRQFYKFADGQHRRPHSSRRLYSYTASRSQNPWVARFIEFALSNAGQQIVAENGFVAQTVKAENTSVAQNAPAEYKRLTNGAERVSLNFRFHRGGKDLDNKARLDLDRVVTFVADLKFSGQNILLLGFADDGMGTDLEISKGRAELVANGLSWRGITPAVVST